MLSNSRVFNEIKDLFHSALFNLRREGFIFICKYFPYHVKMRMMEIREGFDKKFGTETSNTCLVKDSEPLSSHVEDASVYAPTIGSVFKMIMNNLDIQHSEYSFIDLGSGKGRALLLASNYPFKKIIGVEFCKKLHKTCIKNIDIYKSKTKVLNDFELHLEDASAYKFPTGNIVIYLFNPFDEKIFLAIIDNIKNSELEAKRKIIVIYWHPLFNKYIEKLNFKILHEKKDEYFIYGWKIYNNF